MEASDSYEHGVVKRMLPYAGMNEKEAVQLHRERFGTGKLSLLWFYEQFPDFPLHVGVGRFGWVHQLTLADLTSKPKSLNFVRAFYEFVEVEGLKRRSACIVFRWPGMPGGTHMACSNVVYRVEKSDVERFLLMLRTSSFDVLCVERFQDLLSRFFQ